MRTNIIYEIFYNCVFYSLELYISLVNIVLEHQYEIIEAKESWFIISSIQFDFRLVKNY